MRIQSEEYFIKVYNELITENGDYHLTDRELYLFSILYMDRRLDGTSRSTLSTISNLMTISFSNRKDRNAKVIKETLYSLKRKKIINFVNADEEFPSMDILRASDYIIISFNEMDSGFAQIFYNEFELCTTLSDYYIFTAVKRWENAKEDKQGIFKCDYDRFARILGVARSTAQRNIDEAVDKKIIYRNTGDYIDNEDGSQKIQALNEYKVTPFEDEEKSMQTKKKEHGGKYSDESVYDELEGDFYYSEDDLEGAYNDWNMFTNDDDEQHSPTDDAHLLVIEVEENIKHRKPTKMEYKLIDKAGWRTELMMKNPRGEEEWHKAREIAMYDYDVKLGNIDPEVR